MLLSSHWTVGQVPWQLYLRALVDPQSRLAAVARMENPWEYSKGIMKCLSTDQVSTCLMCGRDMADTHLLHLLGKELGMFNFRGHLHVYVHEYSQLLCLMSTGRLEGGVGGGGKELDVSMGTWSKNKVNTTVKNVKTKKQARRNGSTEQVIIEVVRPVSL